MDIQISNCNNILTELIAQYQQNMRENGTSPEWAVHKNTAPSELVPCTIPFVGKCYANQEKKILVYASAENLTDYYDRPEQDRFDEFDKAINRHRAFFQRPSGFFPDVHLQPMNDGGLATAAMYLTSKIRGTEAMPPREFYETIAFGNYGKYSIETEFQKAVRLNPQLSAEEKKKLKKELDENNRDTANKPTYLKESHAYIRADIEVLQPDFIIMPSMRDKKFIDSIKGSATIIRIYQINGTVVNNMAPNTRNNFHSKYNAYNPEQLSPTLQTACDAIRRINHENFMYVFDYLDSVLQANDIL